MTIKIGKLEEEAEFLARQAHADLLDMQGNPAIWHIERVANRVKNKYNNPYLTAIAWLHDIIEDTDITAADLFNLGFPERVVKGVIVITHKDNQNYFEYVEDIRMFPDVRSVKIEDVKENLERGKVGLDKRTQDRLYSKHSKALEILTS